MAAVEFVGQDIFINTDGRQYRVYPAHPGTYWVDMERYPNHNLASVDTSVLIVDDFGNMVDGFAGAHQRNLFRQDLH